MKKGVCVCVCVYMECVCVKRWTVSQCIHAASRNPSAPVEQPSRFQASGTLTFSGNNYMTIILLVSSAVYHISREISVYLCVYTNSSHLLVPAGSHSEVHNIGKLSVFLMLMLSSVGPGPVSYSFSATVDKQTF